MKKNHLYYKNKYVFNIDEPLYKLITKIIFMEMGYEFQEILLYSVLCIIGFYVYLRGVLMLVYINVTDVYGNQENLNNSEKKRQFNR